MSLSSKLWALHYDLNVKIFAHRGHWNEVQDQNSMCAFRAAFEHGYSVELDVWKSDASGSIWVGHDVGVSSLRFEEVLDLWETFPDAQLAINIKCDGLAKSLKQLMQNYFISRIDDFFVFDMATPERIIYEDLGFPVAYRISEYEPLDLVKERDLFWLDSFYSEWFWELEEDDLQILLSKSIVVSPELHGRDPFPFFEKIKKYVVRGLCLDKIEAFMGGDAT